MAEIKSTNKYLIKRKYKTINGTTYPMDEYQVILYKAESEDCGFIRPQYQWSATTGYICDFETYTKYSREVKMVSYDSGTTWSVAQPVEEQKGSPIAYDSYDCGKPMYRCVETMETGCVVGDVKCALYDNNNNLIKYKNCGDINAVLRTDWSDNVAPSSIYRLDVGDCATSIGVNAFSGCTNLAKVSISNTVNGIYDSAFEDCTSLTSCTIGSGVTIIDIYAFRHCSGLTSIALPSSLTSIEDSAFYGCRGLTSVNIPNSVTGISQNAFYGCTGLTSCTIGRSVTSIGYRAFEDCSSLTSINIPNSVTSINDAWNGCGSLTSITVNSNNAVYDSRNNCNAIIKTDTNKMIRGCVNTIIPNDVTYVGGFYGCTGLTSIGLVGSGASLEIPNSVRSISERAFEDCSGLTSITIPNSVTIINAYAFEGCTSLSSITIPSSVTSIGSNVFSGCTSLRRVELDTVTVKTWFSRNTYISTLILGDNVRTINAYAFEGCTSLSSITIPSSVTTIGSNVFSGCTSLRRVELDTVTVKTWFSGNTYITTLILGNDVRTIQNSAFRGCYNLTSIDIPSGVTSIGDTAFNHCQGLTSITIKATTPPTLGTSVFNATNNCPIYVPAESVNAYKAAENWSTYESRIQAITT